MRRLCFTAKPPTGKGYPMYARARALTVSEVSQWCETTGADPVQLVSELLAGEQTVDFLGLLGVGSAQRSEDSFQIA